MAIIGGGLIVSGVIVANLDKSEEFITAQQLVGFGISAIGIVSTFSSIPFYILSYSNKKKSLKISPQTGNIIIDQKTYATTGIAITF